MYLLWTWPCLKAIYKETRRHDKSREFLWTSIKHKRAHLVLEKRCSTCNSFYFLGSIIKQYKIWKYRNRKTRGCPFTPQIRHNVNSLWVLNPENYINIFHPHFATSRFYTIKTKYRDDTQFHQQSESFYANRMIP